MSSQVHSTIAALGEDNLTISGIPIFSSLASDPGVCGGNDQIFGNEGDDLVVAGPGMIMSTAVSAPIICMERWTRRDPRRRGRRPNHWRCRDGYRAWLDGNDNIDGGGDADWLFGQAGDDVIVGGFGNDFIEGNDGVDHLAGNEDDDIVFGGNDNDTIDGDAGDDNLEGKRRRRSYSGRDRY